MTRPLPLYSPRAYGSGDSVLLLRARLGGQGDTPVFAQSRARLTSWPNTLLKAAR